ncbi:hypothetical protein F2Q70_00009939 [Brassica cretica]|uniref:Diphthine--ammonia ligase n=1 Tax=Brassica cretica TaxID=69181 RepID=A0A8S9M2V7_BRACR|nr:hypothetical protein F2Q70_00009939 [Brassica cretica]
MKVVALVSGGKDSCYVMMKCIQYGHEIVALANLLPVDDSVDELDSYMPPDYCELCRMHECAIVQKENQRFFQVKPNFVFPRNFLGNSSGYSEDFIFRRNVRQNIAVFL